MNQSKSAHCRYYAVVQTIACINPMQINTRRHFPMSLIIRMIEPNFNLVFQLNDELSLLHIDVQVSISWKVNETEFRRAVYLYVLQRSRNRENRENAIFLCVLCSLRISEYFFGFWAESTSYILIWKSTAAKATNSMFCYQCQRLCSRKRVLNSFVYSWLGPRALKYYLYNSLRIYHVG